MKRPSRPSADLFGAGPAEPTNRPAYTVSELGTALRLAAESVVGQVWIKGEVIGMKTSEAGHWYFTLKDAESQLRCVMWRAYAQRQRLVPVDGVEVYVLGTPTVWTQRGELRINAVALLPTAGVGLQQRALERTRERLAEDGLLDPARKRGLPAFPRGTAWWN